MDRRILVNYRIDPSRAASVLPPPFRPQLVNGWAIGGICLIRLRQVRPKFVPIPWGLTSENSAHRLAVQWDHCGQTQTGVFIPRRDTSSRLNAFVGGKIFPGLHHHAHFEVAEGAGRYSLSMQSDDGEAAVYVSGKQSLTIPPTSVFGSLETASHFFANGSLGYSSTQTSGRFDGLELRCDRWHVESLEVDTVRSSFFDNQLAFPRGSVRFDCALLMRNINHEWHTRPELCCSKPIEYSSTGFSDSAATSRMM